MRVALLGTGAMGIGMVHSLLRAGHEVSVWNRHAERAMPLADDGASVASSSVEAVAGAEVVITMLFDEAAVAEVAAEFLPSMPHGAIWMQSATVGVAGIARLAELASANDRTMVDAPVVGTKKPAEDGALAVLVSGQPAAIAALAPVLEAIGSKTVEAGPEIGNASALKLACNAWVASITAATAQSIQLCRALGVDPAMFLSTIDGSASNTPYLQLKGTMMLREDFEPAFALDGVIKDLGLMQDAARGRDFAPELLDTLHKTFTRASEAGHGSDDIAAVIAGFSSP